MLREVDEQYSDTNAWFDMADADFEGGFGALHPGLSWIDGIGARLFARYMGSYGADFGELSDTDPENLAFADMTGVTPGATATAAMAEALAGINRGAPITITGGEYRIVNDLDGTTYQDWTSAAGRAHPYQRLELRQTASASGGTTTTATVTVGTVSADWRVSTAAGQAAAPASTTPPAITGDFTEGQSLTVSNGAWDNGPDSHAYQWTRDGADIAGATASAYTLTADDVGTTVDCDVTASNAAGSATVSATGEAVVSAAAAMPAGIADIASGAWYDMQAAGGLTTCRGRGDTLSWWMRPTCRRKVTSTATLPFGCGRHRSRTQIFRRCSTRATGP